LDVLNIQIIKSLDTSNVFLVTVLTIISQKITNPTNYKIDSKQISNLFNDKQIRT